MNAQDHYYESQGYQLPEGMTWEDVERLRAKSEIETWMVPLARAGGAIAWGVPFKDSRPLKRLIRKVETTPDEATA